MKLLTRDTDYAVQILIYMARHRDKFVSARDISLSAKIPFAFTRRILQKLSKEGIISSKEGLRGGSQLKLPPEKLTLMRLIRVFQGPVTLVDCVLRRRVCPKRPGCVLRKSLRRAEALLNTEWDRVTIQKLVEGGVE